MGVPFASPAPQKLRLREDRTRLLWRLSSTGPSFYRLVIVGTESALIRVEFALTSYRQSEKVHQEPTAESGEALVPVEMPVIDIHRRFRAETFSSITTNWRTSLGRCGVVSEDRGQLGRARIRPRVFLPGFPVDLDNDHCRSGKG